MENRNIALSDLLLDPNNYRLQEQDGYVPIEGNRFHIDRVQSGTLSRLRKENIKPLRDSIVSNGFLEVERIVVTPYEHAPGKYVVIEGNRRIAALMQIRDELNAGVNIPDPVEAVLREVPCIVAQNENVPFFRETLMGIRHVGGIKAWGGYQAAKLIADMIDTYDLDAPTVSQRLGLSVIEVNRRYRAYKALAQMKDDEIYSDFATASMYPIFHEAVALPVVRAWLGWDQGQNRFVNEEEREQFYQLLIPRQLNADEEREPKIRTFADVRLLREILANPEAKAELLNLEKELSSSVALVNQERIVGRWINEVSEARSALEKIPAPEVKALDAEKIRVLEELIAAAQEVLNNNRLLNNG